MKYRLAFAWILRLAFVALLTISGIGKLLDGREASQFLIALANSHPIVKKWAAHFIIGLSVIEIVLACSLLAQKSVRIGLTILSGILVLFSAALTLILVRDVPIDACGCFGSWGGEISVEIALIKNLILLFAVLGCTLLLGSNPRSAITIPSTESSKKDFFEQE
jgi:hypothetical protein